MQKMVQEFIKGQRPLQYNVHVKKQKKRGHTDIEN